MARVVRRAASAAAWRAPSRATDRRARKHKVIMESVTQEKRKLRSVICFEAKAPTGYTFIPAGNPLLTTTCKERCRNENRQVFAVSTTPHAHTHTLSKHVHRMGYHFPSTIVAAVCSELGLYLTSAGKAVPFHTLSTLAHQPSTDSSEVSQEVLNTEARDTIKDLFPRIPDKDLFQIIKTAFQKGQNKVGTASELPLARRAQLATVAHIRHCYTDYDRRLKQGSFQEARSAVEHSTLAKVIAWRGDDEDGQIVLEDGQIVLEDVFREVIVISDDDDDDSDLEEEMTIAPGSRDLSVEILSNSPRTHEIVQTRPISIESGPSHDATRELSEEAPPGFRVITKMPAQEIIDRRGFSRYQAWNRALNRYRAETQRTEQPHSGEVLTEQQIQFGANGGPKTLIVQKPHEAQNSESGLHWGVNASHLQGNFPFVLDPSRPERIPAPLNDNGNEPVFVSGPRELPVGNEIRLGPSTENQKPPRVGLSDYSQDHILPSIEAPWPPEKRRTDTRLESMTKRMSLRSVTPVNPSGDAHDNGSGPGSPDDQNPKRRRLAYYPATQHISRSVSRDVRPIGIPISEEQGPRDQYRHDDLGLESRSQDMHYRIYPPSTEQSLLTGHQRDRQPGPFAPQVSSIIRWDLDRTRVVNPSAPIPIHNLQPSSGASGMSAVGDPTSRATLDSSRRQIHPSYYGDRNPRMDHIRRSNIEEPRPAPWTSRTDPSHAHALIHGSNIEEPRPAPWTSRTDPSHAQALIHDLHSGKQYADGFIRSVDYREARQVGYFVENSRPQPINMGEGSFTRIPDQRTQDVPQSRAASEQRQIPSPRVPQVVHRQTSHYPDPAFGSRQPHGRNLPRERRPGSGLGNPRRVHDPRAFQMAEQNRPIYVQRVETQLPQYSMPDGRPVVIVD